MKSRTAMLLLAISGLALSAEFTAASASRMDGKCCRSSDGGRSYRYQMATKRAAIPHTCGAYTAACFRNSSTQGDRLQK
jgi:hypothetical protein